MNAESHASAHCDTVHIGDVRLSIGGNEMIKPIFEGEVIFGTSLAVRAGSIVPDNGYNVAAGAECLLKNSLWFMCRVGRAGCSRDRDGDGDFFGTEGRAANYNDVG